jgi:hypothetical protein
MESGGVRRGNIKAAYIERFTRLCVYLRNQASGSPGSTNAV